MASITQVVLLHSCCWPCFVETQHEDVIQQSDYNVITHRLDTEAYTVTVRLRHRRLHQCECFHDVAQSANASSQSTTPSSGSDTTVSSEPVWKM